MSLTDDERRKLEAAAYGSSFGKPDLLMPTTDQQALYMFVIHALRDMSTQQRETNSLMSTLHIDVRQMRETMVRHEEHGAKLKELEAEVAALKAERDRRAGMQWLVEWVAKYVPWLAAAAAAVWAIKSQPPV
jgi:hypothetical protein